jgi:hypothetical protein
MWAFLAWPRTLHYPLSYFQARRSHRKFGRAENTEFPNNPRVGFLSGYSIAMRRGTSGRIAHRATSMAHLARSTNECETRSHSQVIVSLLQQSIMLLHMY